MNPGPCTRGDCMSLYTASASALAGNPALLLGSSRPAPPPAGVAPPPVRVGSTSLIRSSEQALYIGEGASL